MVIGLFIPISWHWHWPKIWPIMSGVVQAAEARGARVVVYADASPSDHIDLTESRGGEKASGAIGADGFVFAFPNVSYQRYAEELHRKGVPIVLVGRRAGDVPRVMCDNHEAIRRAVRNFAARGHRRIAFACGGAENPCAQERLRGYRDGLKENGLAFDPSLMIPADFSEELCRAEIATRVKAGLRFSAVISTNDLMAIGAIDALRECGLRVPSDVEVVGFDNVPRAHWSAPSLSTFDMQAYQLGFLASDAVARRIGGETIPTEVAVPAPLVVRGSTRDTTEFTGFRAIAADWTEGEFYIQAQIGRLRRNAQTHRLLSQLGEHPLGTPEFAGLFQKLLNEAARRGVSANSLYPVIDHAAARNPSADGLNRTLELLSAAAIDEQKRQLETGVVFAAASLPLRELSFEGVEESVIVSRLRTTLGMLRVDVGGLYLEPLDGEGETGTWWDLSRPSGPVPAKEPELRKLLASDSASRSFLVLPIQYHDRELGLLALHADTEFVIYYPDLAGQLAAALHGARMHRALARANHDLEAARAASEKTNAELAKSYDALRESELFYHSLVESLPQSIARKDAEGRFTYVNSVFAEFVHRPAEEIVGRTDAEIYPADVAAMSRKGDLQVMSTRQPLEHESVETQNGKRLYYHLKKIPLLDDHGVCLGVQVLMWDMTVFRETEELLRRAQRELMETSRLAGIAEMATGVLHNLGNALNSVNTSVGVSAERLRHSRVVNVRRVAELLDEHRDSLAEFLTRDPRGMRIIDYLKRLGGMLEEEKAEGLHDFDFLRESIEHLNHIVAAQQSFANVAGITEDIAPSELLEYALRICDASLVRHEILVNREFAPSGPVRVQRQKVLQVLVNLVNNAKDALKIRRPGERRITVASRQLGERVEIVISDNGEGIAPDNLTRIFAFGFTTKPGGHGFGLHSSALAAKEMHGSLLARSDGSGKGATFVLELPLAKEVPATGTAAETAARV